jgi:hypothetical protein
MRATGAGRDGDPVASRSAPAPDPALLQRVEERRQVACCVPPGQRQAQIQCGIARSQVSSLSSRCVKLTVATPPWQSINPARKARPDTNDPSQTPQARGKTDATEPHRKDKTTWDQVVEQANGGNVDWFLWGGADNINQYVSDHIGGILKDQYGITLNRVGLTDTVEAVNIVLGEKESGVTDKGSVDMIWISGENFRTMKQGGLAYCGYTDLLPNNALVNWDNPAIANDFGVPVDGCEVP